MDLTRPPYLMLISLILLALTATHAAAQDEDELVERFDEAFFDPGLNTSFRLQHIEGRQLGDTSPFTMAGATRFVDLVDGVLLLDGQGRVTNGGEVGSWWQLWWCSTSPLRGFNIRSRCLARRASISWRQHFSAVGYFS